MTKFDQIRPDSDDFGQIRPNSDNFGKIWPDSGHFGQIQSSVHWNPAMAAERRRIPSPAANDCKNPASTTLAIRYPNLELSVVDSSYQQTLMPDGGRFPQTCVQRRRV
jgi:hypothetical protein